MNIKWRKEQVVDEGELNRQKWLRELRSLKEELDNNEMLFNLTDDFDLTAYTIHERAALEARYSYLLRLVKAYDKAKAAETQPAARAELILIGDSVAAGETIS